MSANPGAASKQKKDVGGWGIGKAFPKYFAVVQSEEEMWHKSFTNELEDTKMAS